MKKLFSLFLIILFCLSLPLVVAKDPPRPGITPDNVLLWQAELLLEKINIAITYDQAEQIRKATRYSDERLMEMEKMLRREKMQSAQRAAQQHEEFLVKTEQLVRILDYDNKEKEFAKEYEVERDLLAHDETLLIIQNVIRQNEHFTQEEEALVNDAYSLVTAKKDTLYEEIDRKKEETKLKIKANGLRDDELALLEKSIEDEYIHGIKPDTSSHGSSHGSTHGSDHVSSHDSHDANDHGSAPSHGSSEDAETHSQEEDLEENVDSLNHAKEDAVQKPDLPQAVINAAPVEPEQETPVDTHIPSSYPAADALHVALKNSQASVHIHVFENDYGSWIVQKEVTGLLNDFQSQKVDQLLFDLGGQTQEITITIDSTGVFIE